MSLGAEQQAGIWQRMVRIFRHYISPIKLALSVVDFVLVLGCTIGAELLRYYLADLPLELTNGLTAWAAKLLLPVLSIPVLLGVGVYQSESLSDFKVFTIRLTVSLILVGLLSAAILYLFPALLLWRSILALTILLTAVALMASHGVFLMFGSPQFLGKRVLLLGAGEKAKQLKDYADQTQESGLDIVKTVALPESKPAVADSVALADIGPLDRFADKHQIEMIIVTRDDEATVLPLEALIACKLTGIEVKDRLSCFEQIRGYVDVDAVKAEWIVFSEGFRGGSPLERIAKRLSDILLCTLLVVVTSPLLALVALLVKLTSKGPVFYLQERIGLNNKPFKLFKFRSMRQDAEKDGTPQWAAEKDPRITPIGNFIRQTRLDELPQLFNVLSGDMSFVGPRPERPFFVDQLLREIPFYHERHYVKPGITGWAQIRYPYGASVEDAKRKLEYDLYYIKNYSLFLDVMIAIQTVRVILFPSGVR